MGGVRGEGPHIKRLGVKKMIKIGAHMKISKGFKKVPADTANIGGNTFQIFTSSPRVWKVNPLKENDVEGFKNAMNEFNINFEDVLVHSSYLINLASPKDDIREKSINAMIEEIKATDQLGIHHYNFHPGSHLGEGEEFGINKILEGLDTIFKEVQNTKVTILLENVAQKGSNIGYSMEQLGRIINNSPWKERLGITYDTCHGFDSNYDIRKKEEVQRLLDEIDKYIGLNKLKMIHLNDSKYDVGAAKDRHEFIGKGYIGKEGFKTFLSFDEISKLPLILETPGDDPEHSQDIKVVKEIFKELRKL